MFPAPWTRVVAPRPVVAAGDTVAMVAHAFGWWLNSCRIVYVIDAPNAFGFAYGTLAAHVERGEERFSIEMKEDGTVWYDLFAFSRPRYWPVRIAKPLARRLQRRFARESLRAMSAATRIA